VEFNPFKTLLVANHGQLVIGTTINVVKDAAGQTLAGNAPEAIDIHSTSQASQVAIEFDGPKPHHRAHGFEHGVNFEVIEPKLSFGNFQKFAVNPGCKP
jgi:hypothetical protein